VPTAALLADPLPVPSSLTPSERSSLPYLAVAAGERVGGSGDASGNFSPYGLLYPNLIHDPTPDQSLRLN